MSEGFACRIGRIDESDLACQSTAAVHVGRDPSPYERGAAAHAEILAVQLLGVNIDEDLLL